VIHAYPRGRWLVSAVGSDLLLAGLLLAILVAHPTGKLSLALGVAIPLVLLWGFVTLHFPSRVEMDDSSITFHAYGRSHRFLWSDVRAVRVRKFIVRDRVLVRLSPSPPWSGRYWLLDSITGFDELVRRLEKHSNRQT
jgi:hypothetical protein